MLDDDVGPGEPPRSGRAVTGRHSMKRVLISSAAAAGLAGLAHAQITPIGPFTGPLTESFETVAANYQPCVAPRIFGGTADLCTPGNSSAVVTQFWSMFCVVSARTGTNIFGSAGGPGESNCVTPRRP